MATIKKSLNLVIPIDREEGGQIFVHSTPISREIFENYFLVISKTYADIIDHRLGVLSGPRVAYLMLRQISKDMGVWDGESGVYAGLVNEIVRLSNVLIPGSNGWKTVPLHTAIMQQLIDEDTISQIQGELIFFMCVSKVSRADQAKTIMEAAAALLGLQITSLDCTEYKTSLPTLTEIESSGETAITLSVPV